MSNKIIYAGNTLFGIDFGLYNAGEELDHERTKEEILDAFKTEYEKKIIKTLKAIGLKYEGLKWWSPREYNFETDNIDLTITVKNKELFKEAIKEHKETIQENLDKNKSYDGYMATTVNTTEEELEKMKKKEYEPDNIVLGTILQNTINIEFTPSEHYQYEDEEFKE